MAEAEKIKLSDVALAYIKPLYGSHKVREAFDGRALPADPNRDSIIDELKAKGIATPGGGRFWKLTLAVPVGRLEGGGDAARPRKTHGPGTKPRKAQGAADTRGMVQIPKAALPLDHAKVTEFIHAVHGDAQREFERRKQDGLTDVKFARATKGLKGQALRQRCANSRRSSIWISRSSSGASSRLSWSCYLASRLPGLTPRTNGNRASRSTCDLRPNEKRPRSDPGPLHFREPIREPISETP